MTQTAVIKLTSPTDAPDAVFHWSDIPKSHSKEDQIEQNEVVDIIKWVTNDVEELSQNSAFVYALKNVDTSSFESVSNLCQLYNSLILQIKAKWKRNNFIPSFLNKKALIPHLKFIISQCYNRSVSDPEKLNQYPPFSAQVYGETSFELVLEILKCVEITEKDSFIDLGSGVGQVVIQVAAISDAIMCIGIEKAEYPAQCASVLDKEFRRWMAFYGKRYQPYSLERNDFLAPVAHEKIISSSIIFANNFAFGPEVDHQLKERFQNLREGARIVSSKEFCPLNFRITDRNLGDIGSIMKVECLDAVENAVSWTDKPFSYFLHTIDRSFLEKYFARLRNPNFKEEPVVRRDRKGRIIGAKEQDSKPSDEDEDSDSSRAVKRSSGRSPRRASYVRRRRQVATTAAMGRSMMRSPPSRLKVRRRHVSGSVPQTSITQAAASALVRAKRSRALPSRSLKSLDALRRLSSDSSALTSPPIATGKACPFASHMQNPQKTLHDLAELHCRTLASHHASDSLSNSYNDPGMERRDDAFSMAQLHSFAEAKSFAQSSFGDPYTSHNQECTPLALQQYLEICRRMFMDHFYLMRTPAYERDLRIRIRREELRNQELKNRTKALEDSISTYHEQGGALLSTYSNKIGIQITNPAQFFSESRKLIKYHNSLKEKTKNLRKEVQDLSTANHSLVKSYKKMAHNLKESLCSGAVAPSSKTQEALDALHKSLRCEAALTDSRSKDLIQLSPELAHYRPGANSDVTSPRMKSLLKKTLLAVGVPPELSPLKKPKEVVPCEGEKKRKVPAPLNIVSETEPQKRPEIQTPEFCAPKPPNLEIRRASEPPQPSQPLLNRRKPTPTTPQSQTLKRDVVMDAYPTLFSVLDSAGQGKSHVQSGRSMHASLQDLISEEFSRPSTGSPSQLLSHDATPTLTMTSGLGSSICETGANSASNSKDISNINDLFFEGSVSSGDLSASNAGAMLMMTYNSYGGSSGSESRSASPSHLPPRKRHYDQQQFDSATSSLAASGNNTPLTNIVYQ